MLINSRKSGELLKEANALLEKAVHLLAKIERHPAVLQLTPTAIYDLSVNGEVFVRVIALGGKDLSTPNGPDYIADCEHWFVNKSIPDLKQLLGQAESIDMWLHYRSATDEPDDQFEKIASQIDGTWGAFQSMYPKSVLQSSDWKDGLPDQGNDSCYLFSFEDAQEEKKKIRLVLCVGSDASKLSKVAWLAKKPGPSGYEVDAVTLKKGGDTSGDGWCHYVTSPSR